MDHDVLSWRSQGGFFLRDKPIDREKKTVHLQIISNDNDMWELDIVYRSQRSLIKE